MAQAPQNDNNGLIPWIKVNLKSADVKSFITNCKDSMCGNKAAPASFKVSDNSPLTFNLEYETATDFSGSKDFSVGEADDGQVIDNKNWRLVGSDGRIFKFTGRDFKRPANVKDDATLTANAHVMAKFNPVTTNLIGRFDGLKKIENGKNGDTIGIFGRGTATFITSDLLITCAHNVFDGKNHVNLGGSPFIIFNPLKNNQQVKKYQVDWVVYPSQKVTRSTDIAFIKLKTKHQGNLKGAPISSLPVSQFKGAPLDIVFSGYAGELVKKEGARPHAAFKNVNVKNDKQDAEEFYETFPDAIKMQCDQSGYTHGGSGSVGFLVGGSGVAIYSHGEYSGGKANCHTAYAHRITHNDFWLMCALSGDDFNTLCGDYSKNGKNKGAHQAYHIMMNDNYLQNKAKHRVKYHARNEYDNWDSYEENEQDVHGYGYGNNDKHHGHNDYNDIPNHDIIVYNPNSEGASHHDTISNGYGYDHIGNNESEYLLLYSIIILILIGVCCLIIAISSICSFAAGKFHQTIKQLNNQKLSLLHGKHSYDQIDVVTDDQI